MQDIKNSEEYKSLLARANYDDLTKVLNRRAGRERLDNLLEKARGERKMLVVSLCDVNDLKQINDRYGHREGDNMLRYVASAMSREMKENDILFRLSGDEFAMAFYNENQRNAERRMQDILAYLNEKKKYRKVVYETSFSYGLVEIYPEEFYTVEDLLEKADGRMYIQKRNYHILRAKQRLEQQDSSGVLKFVYDKEHLYDALMSSTDDYIFVGNMKTGVFRYPPLWSKNLGCREKWWRMPQHFGAERYIPTMKEAFWRAIRRLPMAVQSPMISNTAPEMPEVNGSGCAAGEG